MVASVDYTPAPTVADFIKSEKFYNFIIGPVGSAKTTGIIFKILYHAMRQQPSPVDGIRRTRFVMIRNTAPQLKDTTIKSFFTWFKPGQAGSWHNTDKTFTFRFADVECEVLFRPLDTPDDVDRVLSLEVTGAVLDEFVQIPQEVVEAVSGRCGRYPSDKDGGPTWWGMWGASNPGNEDDWWYDWLYEPWPDIADEEGNIEPGPEAKARLLGYYEQPGGFEPDAENLDHLPGGRGYYTNLVVGKTKEWVNQFVNAKWGYSLSGTPVYKAFNGDLHVAKKPLRHNPHLPLLIGFDAGLTPAAIFGQQDLSGRILVYRELVSEGMGARRFCREKLIPLLNHEFHDVTEIELIGDPAFEQRAQTDEKTVKMILEDELGPLGIHIRAAPSNDLSARIGSVEDQLVRLTEAGPAYLVDPSCKVLIRGFLSGYQYPKNTKGTVGAKPDKTGKGAKYTHPHDANQYLCLGAVKLGRLRAKRHALDAILGGSPNVNYAVR